MGKTHRTKQAQRKAQVARKRRYAGQQARLRAFPKEALLRGVESLTHARLAEIQDFRRLPWFHDHGVPQVRQLSHAVLRPAAAPSSPVRPTPAPQTV